jgi:ABC-type lipoprotein release transport system permease subunit
VILALAWRNLWRRPRRTALSIAGLAFAAAFLIFMPSLQNGAYRAMIENTLRLYDGYAELEQPGYRDEPDIRDTIADVDPLLGRLRGIDGLEGVSARASAYVLLSADDRSFGAQVLGVEPDTEPDVSRIPRNIEHGRFLAPGADDEIALGTTLARNLGVDVGDVVTLLGTGYDGSLAADTLTVVGAYTTGVSEIDRLTAEIPLARFQETFAMPGQAHTIVLSGPSLAEFSPLVDRVRAIAEPLGLELLEWRDLQPGLWQAIILDASTASLIYIAMVIVVTFTLLNSFLMAVLERTHEFGVLMALGMRPASIGRMVWLESGLMLVLGLGAGMLLGVVVTSYFAHTGIAFGQMEQIFSRFGLPGAMYPRVDALTLLAGPTVIAICTLFAGLFPFLRVYRLQPVAAMRSV